MTAARAQPAVILNPLAYARRALRNAATNEVVHDHTRQREFERKFLSLDWESKEGRRYDVGANAPSFAALWRRMDHEEDLAAAFVRVGELAMRLENANLEKVLWAVFQGRSHEERINFSEVSKATYFRAVIKILNFFLKIETRPPQILS